MNTAEILRAAAQRVRRGWCQNHLADGLGGVCAQGAVMEVMWADPEYLSGREFKSPGLREDFKAITAVFGPVHEALGANHSFIPTSVIKDWNNASGQTAENVAATLELAAILWEEKQKRKDQYGVESAAALAENDGY